MAWHRTQYVSRPESEMIQTIDAWPPNSVCHLNHSLTETIWNSIGFRTWIYNYIHVKQYDMITHPYTNLTGVGSTHKESVIRALMFSLLLASTHCWTNSRVSIDTQWRSFDSTATTSSVIWTGISLIGLKCIYRRPLLLTWINFIQAWISN